MAQSTADAVQLDVSDGVATLTLNDPDRMNPLGGAISTAMDDHLDALLERDDIRCVVVRGAGHAFSAGGDIEGMKERLEGEVNLDEYAQELERGPSDVIRRIAQYPYPTISAVDGPAVGAGANLAIAGDLIIASEAAKIGWVFRNVGLTIDSGTSYMLPRIVGTNIAKELVYTGEILGADRAEELGIFNRVYGEEEFEDGLAEVVDTIANGPTVAFRHAGRLIDEGLEKPLQRAINDESTAQAIVRDTADHAEGVEAFLDDRDPEFEGR
ncbi:MAG: enoyl-CoA hydratase/isomerase family protein [Salinirussus sp.]